MWDGVHAALGVADDALAAQLRADLDSEGYCRLDGHLDAGQVAAALAAVQRGLADSDRRQGGTLHLGGCSTAGRSSTRWCNPRLLAGIVHPWGRRCGSPGQWQVASALVLLRHVGRGGRPDPAGPGSHLDPTLVGKAPDADAPNRGQRTLTGPAGTCWLWNGHLWHSGTRNRGDTPRHALLLNAWRRNPLSERQPAELSAETVDRLGGAALLLL